MILHAVLLLVVLTTAVQNLLFDALRLRHSSITLDPTSLACACTAIPLVRMGRWLSPLSHRLLLHWTFPGHTRTVGLGGRSGRPQSATIAGPASILQLGSGSYVLEVQPLYTEQSLTCTFAIYWCELATPVHVHWHPPMAGI